MSTDDNNCFTQDIDLQIESILSRPELEEDALDFMGCDGAMAAFVIMPERVDIDKVLLHVLDEGVNQITPKDKDTLSEALKMKMAAYQIQFESEGSYTLPWMEEEDFPEEALESWMAGFAEVVFSHEATWFNSKHEQAASELLMPFITLSGLLEDETSEILDNEDLITQWIEEIPDLLVDLFLLYRVEEDKKPSFKKGPSGRSGGGNANKKKRGSRGRSNK
jgi:uncharacterized protein